MRRSNSLEDQAEVYLELSGEPREVPGQEPSRGDTILAAGRGMEGGETAPAAISAVLEASAGTRCQAHREGRPCGVSREQTAAEPQLTAWVQEDGAQEGLGESPRLHLKPA